MSISSISFDRQIGRALFAFGMVAALIASALIPALASAAQLTERSIQLSSSSALATDVTYEVNFTAGTTAAAFVVDFCSNSPVLTEDCDLPAGFDASGAATGSGFAIGALTAPADNSVLVTGTVAAGTNTITLTGIDNPSADGTIYARITTYATTLAAQAHEAGTVVTHVDDGTVALFITDTIGVSGAVLEAMTFCISGGTINPNCVIPNGNAEPTIKLGQTNGDVVALSSTAVSTGDIYTQISTNAASGAVVSIKSTALGCGGLIRAGSDAANGCNIAPALATGIEDGEAKFGLLLDPAVAGGTGTLNALSGYNASDYVLNYTALDAAGVTSTFGDPLFNTNSGTAVSKNAKITFGASIAPNTPAGTYSTDISLIATGKF